MFPSDCPQQHLSFWPKGGGKLTKSVRFMHKCMIDVQSYGLFNRFLNFEWGVWRTCRTFNSHTSMWLPQLAGSTSSQASNHSTFRAIQKMLGWVSYLPNSIAATISVDIKMRSPDIDSSIDISQCRLKWPKKRSYLLISCGDKSAEEFIDGIAQTSSYITVER